MSKENVEVVGAAFEAWNAWDMDALREVHDPDVTARAPEGWSEPKAFAGWEAVRREFEQVRETWDADVVEPTDFIDAGDRVLVRFVWRGTGRGTELTGIFTMRNGRISGIEFFWDHAQALEAVGLRDG